MKITRAATADKLRDYVQGKIEHTELVDWAERAMMDADFDPADAELLSDIIGRLGLADVAEFGCAGRIAKTSFAGSATARASLSHRTEHDFFRPTKNGPRGKQHGASGSRRVTVSREGSGE